MSGRALVLGLGRFGGGREAARFLVGRGWQVRVADRLDADALRPTFAALADLPTIDWQLGREDHALLDDVDLLVVNPAIPPHHPLLAAAADRGVRISQEVELFLDAFPGRTILITGTNGKSTTTTLLARALQRAGFDARAGGNIGHSLLAEVADWHAEQIAILEISSFQLERLDPARHPVLGAVFTRVTRDHLDRHGTLEAYHAAKARAAAAARGFVVHAIDDPVATAYPTPAPIRCTVAGDQVERGTADGWVTADGWLQLTGTGRLLHRDALRLVGNFHLENVLAAALAARQLGAAMQPVALALALQPPLQYRLQQVAVIEGVRVFDNAISTAPESTLSAIESIAGPVRWVGGGKNKDTTEALIPFTTQIAGRLTSAHVFGAVGPDLHRLLDAARLPATCDRDLAGAMDAAISAAQPGDAILFSPAFASFDQFTNFRARAETFHAWLAQAAANALRLSDSRLGERSGSGFREPNCGA